MNRLSTALLVLACGVLLTASAALAEPFDKSFSFADNELTVINLIGQVEVKMADGDEFQVEVRVQGKDASPEMIEFVAGEEDGDVLAIKFPVEKHDTYIYPELGGNSKTTITYEEPNDDGSWLKKIFSGFYGEKITVKGKGNGTELWADVVISVPRGRSLKVKLGVGEIQAAGLAADLNLDTHSGPIEVQDLLGDLVADTGSGHVSAVGMTGDVNVDTGSGSVTVENCEGPEVSVDTGSGSVKADQIDCRKLNIDTGSGSVKARRVKADEAKIDTGSGSVVLELERMGEGRFVVDTGSGGIELIVPHDASARITADTGSGSVRNHLKKANVERMDRDELILTIGDGKARVTLDAGSGSITVSEL